MGISGGEGEIRKRKFRSEDSKDWEEKLGKPGEAKKETVGEQGLGLRYSLNFPKLWLSLFLIFLYLAKVPPPSFFSRITTPSTQISAADRALHCRRV